MEDGWPGFGGRQLACKCVLDFLLILFESVFEVLHDYSIKIKVTPMPTLEQYCERIFSQRRWELRLLMLVLLSISIIGIPWVCGYIGRFTNEIRRTGRPQLPEWQDWGRLFFEGLPVLAILLVWVGAPLLLICLVGNLLSLLIGGYAATLVWIASGLVLVVAAPLAVSALLRFQRKGGWSSILEWRKIIRIPLARPGAPLAASLAMAGMVLIGLPILPAAFFLGFNIFAGYCMTVYLLAEAHS